MPKVLNKTPRQITIAYKDKNKVIKRVIFPPLKLVEVKVEDWKLMQKVYLVKKMCDRGDFKEGAAAGREAIDEDSLADELSKDLTEDENARLEQANG